MANVGLIPEMADLLGYLGHAEIVDIENAFQYPVFCIEWLTLSHSATFAARFKKGLSNTLIRGWPEHDDHVGSDDSSRGGRKIAFGITRGHLWNSQKLSVDFGIDPGDQARLADLAVKPSFRHDQKILPRLSLDHHVHDGLAPLRPP